MKTKDKLDGTWYINVYVNNERLFFLLGENSLGANILVR